MPSFEGVLQTLQEYSQQKRIPPCGINSTKPFECVLQTIQKEVSLKKPNNIRLGPAIIELFYLEKPRLVPANRFSI
jgi:hypothetical protein